MAKVALAPGGVSVTGELRGVGNGDDEIAGRSAGGNWGAPAAASGTCCAC